MRINKFISHNTNYSRREADELIKAGKVSINGRIISDLSTDIKDGDKVKIGSRLVKLKKEFSVILYNKPKGELVTKRDDRGRRTIYDSLP
ncbi:MAG: S4 domain-containing protein, partial [Campylobacter lanienae]|uniref:S4 domain-containing protein n=2 Tax=Campylobacter TaxID=194 RepID=UPI00242BB03B